MLDLGGALWGCAAAAVLGYIAGLGRGRTARRELRERVHGVEERLRRAEHARAAASPRDLRAPTLTAEVTPTTAGAAASIEVTRLREEVVRAVQPLFEQQRAHEARTRHELQQHLELSVRDALAERAPPRAPLEGLDAQLDATEDLTEVLDAVARVGGFVTVLVSDDVGFPLATNRAAESAETLAGISAMLLTLFDRVATHAEPRPRAAVFRDEGGRLVVYRVFNLQGTRLVLTAVNSGALVPPEVLDPALVSIERALNRHRWAP